MCTLSESPSPITSLARWLLVLLGLGCAGLACDAPEAATERDAAALDGAVDAEIRSDATQGAHEGFLEGAPLLENGPLALHRSPDGARLALVSEGALVFSNITATAQLQGETLTALDWPRVNWRASESTAIGRLHGAVGLPDLEIDARLTPTMLLLRARLLGTGGDPLTVDSLGFSGIVPRAGWTVWPAGDGPPVRLQGALERRGGQRLWRPGEALMIQALRWLADSTYIGTLSGRVTIATRWQGTVLGGAGTLESALTAIAADPDPLKAQASVGALEMAGPADRTWDWGWRSGPSWGAEVHPGWVESVAAELVARGSAEGLPAPTVLVEGRWWGSEGWRPNASTLGELSSLTDTISPARLGLRLPLLSDAGDADSGGWRDADGRLSPQVPAARRWLATEAAHLELAGVALLQLGELGAIADATTSRDLVDGIARSAPRIALLTTEPLLAPLNAGAMVSWTRSGLDWRHEQAHVVAADAANMNATARPETLDALAHALAQRWHWGTQNLGGDPGPVLVGSGRSEGEARIAAGLAAMAGGVYLLGDNPIELGAARWRLFFEGLNARGVGRPLRLTNAAPPSVWRSDRALLAINWTQDPLEIRLPAGFEAATPVFSSAPTPYGAVVRIPPRDARGWIRVDE